MQLHKDSDKLDSVFTASETNIAQYQTDQLTACVEKEK